MTNGVLSGWWVAVGASVFSPTIRNLIIPIHHIVIPAPHIIVIPIHYIVIPAHYIVIPAKAGIHTPACRYAVANRGSGFRPAPE